MLSTVFNKASLSSTLYASTQSNLLTPQELDIYYEPPVTVPAEPDKPYPEFLYNNIQSVRKQFTGVFSGLLTTHEKVSDTYSNTEGRIQRTYNRVIEDPYFLLKPGAIALATAGGAVVAGRGRRPLQRSLYSLLFGVTASSVCYPERFVDIVTTGYYHTSSSISQLFSSGQTTTERVLDELKVPEVTDEQEKEKAEGEVTEESIVDVIPESVVESAEKTEILVDAIEVEVASEAEVSESTSIEEVKSEDPIIVDVLPIVEQVAVESEEKNETVEDIEVQEVESKQETPEEIASSTEDINQEEILSVVSESKDSPQEDEGFVVVKVEDSAPAEDITPVVAKEDTLEPYDPKQEELVEVLQSPFDTVDEKDVAVEIEFENDNIAAVEGDPGQSNPEDKDMYSTRS